jgi:FAD/FMN-containing dehydrogenase
VAPSRSLLSEGLKVFQEEVEAIKAMKQRGGNALGIDRDEPLFCMLDSMFQGLVLSVFLLTHFEVILISTAWSNSSNNADVDRMTAKTIERLNATANNLGVANRYKYINYASAAQADTVFSGYGNENLQRLQKIQKAVDPRGIFTSKGLWRGFVKLL